MINKIIIKKIVLSLLRIGSSILIFVVNPIQNTRYFINFYKARNISSARVKKDVPWFNYESRIKSMIDDGLPLLFFGNKTISSSMTGSDLFARKDLLNRIKKLRKVYKFPQSFIGGCVFPINGITAFVTLQRMMHYYQFDKIRNYFDSKDAGNRTIVEWGGGYGGLSLLLFWYFDNLTVVIRDLPNVSIMQYIYLKTHIGNNVNLIQNSDGKIQKNKINLIPTNIEIDIKTDLFVSFWALSESGADDYNKLIDNSFYGAFKVQLITQVGDDKFPVSNKLNNMLEKKELISEIVPGMDNNSRYFEVDTLSLLKTKSVRNLADSDLGYKINTLVSTGPYINNKS